ncbi:hypothetical protein C3L33_01017, partial [Rhododendron williamsianum]
MAPVPFIFPPTLHALEADHDDGRLSAQNPTDFSSLRPSQLVDFVKELFCIEEQDVFDPAYSEDEIWNREEMWLDYSTMFLVLLVSLCKALSFAKVEGSVYGSNYIFSIVYSILFEEFFCNVLIATTMATEAGKDGSEQSAVAAQDEQLINFEVQGKLYASPKSTNETDYAPPAKTTSKGFLIAVVIIDFSGKCLQAWAQSLVLLMRKLVSGNCKKKGAKQILKERSTPAISRSTVWADMLLRMYVRWGEKQRYKTKVVEMSSGEEAGIKSATVEVEGRYAYGYFSGEKGTHHIVRQSPFNAKGLRQTSFSGVEIVPLLPDESMAVEIPEEGLDISFSRAGGKGGQNVNKVETAVRITHIPTGVTVRCSVAWWHGYTVSHLIKTVGIIYMCSYGLFPAENCGGDQLFIEVYQTRELVEGRTFNSR